MKAICVRQFGGPEVLQPGNMPDPVPGPQQVLVRVAAAGVNPADTYIRSGMYARKPSLPYIPGSDGAGRVVHVGTEVRSAKPGDRVYILKPGATGTSGTYAELTACEEGHVHPLPAALSFEQGAAIGIAYATAYLALVERAGARPGETVLVHGASGGVGVATVQLARSRGLVVLGTAGTPRGLDLVRAEGADGVFDHRADGYTDRILASTGGRGVDVIIEMLANVNLARDLTLLAPNGRVAIVGNRGTIEINPREAMGRSAAILGVMLWNASPREMLSAHAAIGAGLANATLRPVVGRTFALADAARAHEAVLAPGAHGKVVLMVAADAGA